MKKSVILVSALTALTLAGCGNQHPVPKKDYEPKKTTVKPQAHNSVKNDSPSTETASSASSQAQAESSSASAASSSSTQQAWTLDSAKNYYLATVMGNDGNPLKLVGDFPTKAQNGPTVWQNMGTSNNGQTMTSGSAERKFSWSRIMAMERQRSSLEPSRWRFAIPITGSWRITSNNNWWIVN